jgi:chromosomal replication initiation ATPase DnaA
MFLDEPGVFRPWKRGTVMWNEMSTGSEPRFSAAGQRALLVQMAVAETTGVEITQISSAKRGDSRSALARQMAMYLCHMVFEMNSTQVGQAFGRDRKTVCHALLRIEELREDHEFDRALSWLESSLRKIGGRA